MGLKHFLDGGTPYARTEGSLRAWYQSHGGDPVPRFTAQPRNPVLSGRVDNEIRAALRHAVDESSLRAVAEQVGLTHHALQLFLRGASRPRELTLHKLRRWYLRQAGTGLELNEARVRTAFTILMEDLPADALEELLTEISEIVRDEYRRQNADVPAWWQWQSG